LSFAAERYPVWLFQDIPASKSRF